MFERNACKDIIGVDEGDALGREVGFRVLGFDLVTREGDKTLILGAQMSRWGVWVRILNKR